MPKRTMLLNLRAGDDTELRALTDKDTQTLYATVMANQAYLAKYLPWANQYHSVADAAAFIARNEEEGSQGQTYGFGVFEGGQFVGHISLMHIIDGGTPEIGYWIAETSAGQGIATRAARTVTDFGFHDLGLKRILVRAREDNIASNKIAKTLGYAFDGVHEADGERHNHWLKMN